MPRAANSPDPRRAYQRGRILAAIKDQALTAQHLADRLHLTRDAINLHLAAMKCEKPRRLYVAGFAPNLAGGRAAPMYRAGSKDDAQYVRSRAPKGRPTVADRQEQILKLLRTEARTATEVAEAMEVQRAKVYLSQLYSASKVYIAQWRPHPDGGYPSPVYAIGNLPDADRPAPSSPHEASARYWAKLKADPHRHGLMLKRNRMRRKPQTWFSALM